MSMTIYLTLHGDVGLTVTEEDWKKQVPVTLSSGDVMIGIPNSRYGSTILINPMHIESIYSEEPFEDFVKNMACEEGKEAKE